MLRPRAPSHVCFGRPRARPGPGYRTEVVTASNGWPNRNRESLTHTMDFTWNFRRNMDFFVNARNILNQNAGTYRLRSDLRTRWVETGAIWSTGVRATF